MKKNVVIGIIIILVVGIGIFLSIKNRIIVRPNTNYVAIIYHSEMIGIDAGYEYIYYIYPDENDTYLYIKSKAEITLVGSSEEKDINSGKIKKESDFEKIKEDIEKDKLKDSQEFLSYTYINKDKKEKYNSLEELGNRLFYKADIKVNNTNYLEDNSLENKSSALERYTLSQDYIGCWCDNISMDEITIYSINNNKIEFDWSVYRICSIDRTIATLISENTATFDYNDGFGIIYQGIITFGKNEISLEVTKAEGFEYITEDYKTTFNVNKGETND